jgi:hypothetical protein
MALPVFTMGHGGNYSTLKTAFDAIMIGLLLELLHFNSLVLPQKLPLLL